MMILLALFQVVAVQASAATPDVGVSGWHPCPTEVKQYAYSEGTVDLVSREFMGVDGVVVSAAGIPTTAFSSDRVVFVERFGSEGPTHPFPYAAPTITPFYSIGSTTVWNSVKYDVTIEIPLPPGSTESSWQLWMNIPSRESDIDVGPAGPTWYAMPAEYDEAANAAVVILNALSPEGTEFVVTASASSTGSPSITAQVDPSAALAVIRPPSDRVPMGMVREREYARGVSQMGSDAVVSRLEVGNRRQDVSGVGVSSRKVAPMFRRGWREARLLGAVDILGNPYRSIGWDSCRGQTREYAHSAGPLQAGGSFIGVDGIEIDASGVTWMTPRTVFIDRLGPDGPTREHQTPQYVASPYYEIGVDEDWYGGQNFGGSVKVTIPVSSAAAQGRIAIAVRPRPGASPHFPIDAPWIQIPFEFDSARSVATFGLSILEDEGTEFVVLSFPPSDSSSLEQCTSRDRGSAEK